MTTNLRLFFTVCAIEPRKVNSDVFFRILPDFSSIFTLEARREGSSHNVASSVSATPVPAQKPNSKTALASAIINARKAIDVVTAPVVTPLPVPFIVALSASSNDLPADVSS